MSKREFFLRIVTGILLLVGVGHLAVSQIHIAAITKIFANQIGFYLFVFVIFGLTTGSVSYTHLTLPTILRV